MPAPHQPPVRADGLQLDEPRAFQRRFWTAQRWSWAVFALLIALALAGGTGGGGLLSRQVIETAEGAVEAPRIARRGAADTLRLTLRGEGPTRTVTVSETFGQAFEMTGFHPLPSRVEALPGGERWSFAAEDAAPARVTVRLRPSAIGPVRFGLALGDGPTHDLAVFVLP
jgi:hypothetical protein